MQIASNSMASFRTAKELLDRVADRYRSLSSYSDVGVIRPRGTSEPLTCWFETDYQFPGKFRFQFIRPHPRRRRTGRWIPMYRITKYVVGSNGNGAYLFTQERGRHASCNDEESLELAIAGATGISRGAAHTIGRLLLPSVEGFSLLMLRKPRLKTTRAFEGINCYRVSGLHPWAPGRYTAWIGTEDLLLRKLIKHRASTEEVRWDIHVDTVVDPLRFEQPGPDAC